MNFSYRNIFLALLAAILIAVPTAMVLQGKNAEIQKANQNRLIEIKKRDDALQLKQDQLKQKTDENIELKKQNDQLQKDLQAKAKRKAEEAQIAAANAEKQKAAVSVSQAAPSGGGSCRDAIRQTWPAHLQEGAIIVMTHENRSENPAAVGAVNNDGHGSQDFGCFQINNYWHKGFFASNDWRDPVANARYAYTIYQGRGNFTAWYAVQGILW